MTTSDHHKKSDFVLLKSLISFYGQVNKASEHDMVICFMDLFFFELSECF